MHDLEANVTEWINKNQHSFTKKVKRFLAMYFPNALIRRIMWQKTNVELGEGTYLNPNISIVDDYQSDAVLVKIGAHCSIAPGVVFAPYSAHNNSVQLREMNLLDKYEKKALILVVRNHYRGLLYYWRK
jgi:hypothetical protein